MPFDTGRRSVERPSIGSGVRWRPRAGDSLLASLDRFSATKSLVRCVDRAPVQESTRVFTQFRGREFFEKRSDTERRKVLLESRDVFSRESDREARDQVVEWIVGSLD